jgi:hypothetical protein
MQERAMPSVLRRLRRLFRRLNDCLVGGLSPTQAAFRRRRNRGRSGLGVEALEDRCLMASGISAQLLVPDPLHPEVRVLRILGTTGNDQILVRQDAGQISIVGTAISVGTDQVSKVDAGRVTRIEIQGNGGDDVIRLDQGSQPITVPALIQGGSGKDFIAGGEGNDTIHVGSKDTVWVGGGKDAVDGAALPSAASLALREGLTSLARWLGKQAVPLVGNGAGIQQAIQQGLIDPISTYLAQHDPTTDANFVTFLKGLSAQSGGLTVTVDPSSVQKVVTGKSVRFDLNFQAKLNTTAPLACLGSQADLLGIRADPSALVNVTTILNFAFGFGLDANQAFFLRVPTNGLSAQVSASAADVNANLNFGFLGASIQHGTAQLNAKFTLSATGTNSDGSLSLADLLKGKLAVAPGASVNVKLPLSVQVGGLSTQGTLTVASTDLSQGDPTLQIQGLDGWKNFTTFSASSVLGLLTQLGSQLGQLGAEAWSAALPLADGRTLGQTADVGKAFQAHVLNQLGSWNSLLNQQMVKFANVQELTTLLAKALGVDPSQLGVAFDPTTNLLTYRLAFTHTFSELAPADLTSSLNVNLNGGGLSRAGLGNGQTGPQLSLAPRVQADLTLGVNLTPVGYGYKLTPTTTLTSLNAGAGVRTNGASATDLRITLTDGTSFEVDLDGTKTVQDVINAIQKASGGKVQVGIDPQTGGRFTSSRSQPPRAVRPGT